jgi:pyruvate formate lyase activating enzyme
LTAPTSLPRIRGIQENTLIDWEGRLATIVFLEGCNFRCPFCHSRDLVLNPGSLEVVPLAYVDRMIANNAGWLDGIVISGGEPTLHEDLPDLIRHFRELGQKVKLNTNGSDPITLASLMKARLLDAIAMDIKGPLDGRYERCAGVPVDLDAIRQSIEIIIGGDIEYEFCTTACPAVHTEQDVLDTAKGVRGASRFVLQNFRALDLIDESLKDVQPYTTETMRVLARDCEKYVRRCIVRGDPTASNQKP